MIQMSRVLTCDRCSFPIDEEEENYLHIQVNRVAPDGATQVCFLDYHEWCKPF